MRRMGAGRTFCYGGEVLIDESGVETMVIRDM